MPNSCRSILKKLYLDKKVISEKEYTKLLRNIKTESWNDEDVDSVLGFVRQNCRQRRTCDGCRFRGSDEQCKICGLPSNWVVEMKGGAE